MRAGSRPFQRIYGAPVRHLLILSAAFALTAYTISVFGIKNLFNPATWWQSIAVWFAVAIVAHDLILFPLYTLADRLIHSTRRPPMNRDGTEDQRSGRIPLTNYLRMPTLASGLLLLMFFPGIIGQGASTFQAATGLTQAPYLTRWLLITAGLYLASAGFYLTKTLVRQCDNSQITRSSASL